MRINISRKRKIIQIFIVCSLLILIFTPFLSFLATYNNSDYDQLKVNSNNEVLSKDNFSPLISQEKNGLGNVSISSFNYHKIGYTDSNTLFPELNDDVNNGALNITYSGTKMIKNTQVAQVDNLIDIVESNSLKVLLNDTLNVTYDKSKISGFNGYLIYRPELNPMIIKEVYVNGTILNEGDYYFLENRFMKFYYYNYFGQQPKGTFTIHFVFEYEMSLINWNIFQADTEDLVITKKEQILEPKYTYRFNLQGKRWESNQLQSLENTDDVELELVINLPDKDLLENHKLTINNRVVGDSEFQTYMTLNKSIEISLLTNNTLFSLNFTSQFLFKFFEPVFRSFGIDRLYKENNIRERLYFPTIVSGPSRLLVQYASIFERDFEDEDVIQTASQFNRPFTYIDANDSDNTQIKKGIEIILPYLIKDEICPLSIRYQSSEVLRIIINDNINTPIYDLNVKLNYYGKEFGTFVSNNWTQPTAPLTTDQNGEIILRNVPQGNYSIEVFYNNQVIKTQSVSTLINPNIISTNIPHFPLVFLVFLSISGSIFLVGLIIYLLNKRNR